MKKIFIAAFIAVSALVVSCSNEDSVKDDVVNNINAKSSTVSSEITDFLKSFYRTNYQLGRNVATKDENNTEILITEVVITNEGRARGYVVTDANTGKFLYFADVNRQSFVLHTYEAATKVYDKVYDINKTELYAANQYDFIEIIEAANASITKGGWFFFAQVKIALDHFWYSDTDTSGISMGADANGNAVCTRTITTRKVRFWINWGTTTTTVTVPCP